MEIELDTPTIMMILFIILLATSIWKIYAFLPNKELADDDTTEASQEELINLILKVIKENKCEINSTELFEKVKADSEFDSKHFWRFNQNRLNQLLTHYSLKNSNLQSIKDIYISINTH